MSRCGREYRLGHYLHTGFLRNRDDAVDGRILRRAFISGSEKVVSETQCSSQALPQAIKHRVRPALDVISTLPVPTVGAEVVRGARDVDSVTEPETEPCNPGQTHQRASRVSNRRLLHYIQSAIPQAPYYVARYMDMYISDISNIPASILQSRPKPGPSQTEKDRPTPSPSLQSRRN